MNNSDKVYPQVDDVPDNIKKEWLNNSPQSTYTKFQEWLADCPTQIEDYKDNVDHVIIRFDLPITEEKVWTITPRIEVANL